MPIRINLLAEAQALEELRRRDPVKRAIWVGSFLVALMLVWSAWLFSKARLANHELKQLHAQITARSTKYQQALDSEKKLADVNWKLAELQCLATNRFLFATLLNALQQTTADEVQLLRLRADQSWSLNEEVKAKSDGDRVIPGKPASVTERAVIKLDARDNGANPGDQVPKFKRAVAEAPYFHTLLGKTNEVRLTSLSPPQSIDGTPCVLFTLECRLPEKTR